MEARRFCVYNQASECFLSLGVIATETIPAQLKASAGRQASPYDEGFWIALSSELHRARLAAPAPLDLIYLDKNYRVVHLVESFHRLRMTIPGAGAASVLALPAHAIYSSQTQVGHQLVICATEELAFQLSGAPGFDPPAARHAATHESRNVNWFATYLSHGAAHNRRQAPRQVWPRLVAYDWDGAELAVHGIRDASATGLYLLTEKRWPLGARVWMTLQRTDGAEESAESSITVQMEVTRWGSDGVGLAFVLPENAEHGRRAETDPAACEEDEPLAAAAKSGFIN